MYSFSETQKFRQWWIWAILLVPCAGFLLAFLFLPPSEKQSIGPELWLSLGLVMVLGTGLILLLRLESHIDEEKIRFRFIPFHFRSREIFWNEVEKAFVRQYKPIKEYGGWGIRHTFRNGKAFNVKGNKGLQLELKNGKKILIGTQKSEELELLLLKIKKSKQ